MRVKPSRAVILLASCLFLLSSCKKDQLHWSTTAQIFTGTDQRLNKVVFINDSVGFIPGGTRYTDAVILVTTDRGSTWTAHSFPDAGKEVYDVTAAPDGSVWALALGGRLLHTHDNFTTHTLMQVDDESYKSIQFTNANRFFCIGGISFEEGVYGFYDTSGNRISHTNTKAELNTARLFPDGTGYMAGYGTMLKTFDGGSSWSYLDIQNDNLLALSFRSEDIIYTCGTGGSVFSSSDGGNSWQRLRNGDDLALPRYHLQDILMLNAQQGYCVGDNGLVIYTDDGGKHWSEVDKFTDYGLRGLALLPGGDLLTCGDNGTLYRLHR